MLSVQRRYRRVIIPAVIMATTVVYVVGQYHYQISNFLSYATRPLWDAPDKPKDVIPHYYSEGMQMNEAACKLHGWELREKTGSQVKVLDAVLMSTELDLLEIRMHELDPIVDHFFIVESNATFTGLPKQTFFADNRERFAKFEQKIIYDFFPGHPLKPNESAWNIEARSRKTVTRLIRSQLHKFPQDTDTLVIMSDVDEIPSRHTISLLKTCMNRPLLRSLNPYIWNSFEWYIGLSSWRASLQLWLPSTYYRHSMSTDLMLADAGWHCSYCFRTIQEYVVKMTGFSHSDRLGAENTKLKLLDPSRIQDTICTGKDIFGMLPEAYSYADMISQMSLTPYMSAVGLPLYLIENAAKFKYMLPGGCKRDG